jgi:hypothetical protein
VHTFSVDSIFVDANFVDTVNPLARDVPFDFPLRVNSVVDADDSQVTCFQLAGLQLIGERELADGWHPYPAWR